METLMYNFTPREILALNSLIEDIRKFIENYRDLIEPFKTPEILDDKDKLASYSTVLNNILAVNRVLNNYNYQTNEMANFMSFTAEKQAEIINKRLF